jgi:transcriptional regulator with XRE-family HTH domain
MSVDDLRAEILARDPDAARRWEATAPRRRLSDALLALRKRAGLSQSAVARAAGWNQTHVARMESATGPWPNRDSLMAYVRVCDPDAVVGLVFAHHDGERLQIDTAVAFGNEPSDRQLECLTDTVLDESTDPHSLKRR